MLNVLQKMVYNLSCLAPLCFIFAVVNILKFHTIILPTVFIVITLLLFIGLFVLFVYVKKNIPNTDVKVTDISPHYSRMVLYVISYILPLVSITIYEFNLFLSGFIGFIIIVTTFLEDYPVLNLPLRIIGYHFYKLKTIDGMSGYVLISKRKIRNSNEINHVKPIFEYLLLDPVKK